MKRRRFLLSILCIICFSVLSRPFTASAAIPSTAVTTSPPQYLRVITNATPFYADENAQNLLFYLPYTYYVKVLSVGETLAHVECFLSETTPALDGYAPTEMLYADGLAVSAPYPNLKLKTAVATVLYADSRLTVATQYLFAERELTFYGKLDGGNGVPVYYVEYNNKLGYVSEADIFPFTLPNHDNPLTFLQTPANPSLPSTEASGGGATDVKIIIIVCLALAGGLGLIIALTKKPKTQAAASYYDENDYE